MSALISIYWLCFGIGFLYVLCAGMLGAVGHGFGGHGGDIHAGEGAADSGGMDMHAEAGGGEATDGGGMESADLDTGTDLDSAAVEAAGAVHAGGDHMAHGGHGGHDLHSGEAAAVPYSPFSPLSIMGFICAFGAGGLIATALKFGVLPGLGFAGASGISMALLLWLLIGKVLFGMQGSSEAHQSDMLGLEAEALTPIDEKMAGEIAYILDGVRYTSPARLTHPGSIAKNSTVRIKRIENNVAYVEEKRKLLA